MDEKKLFHEVLAKKLGNASVGIGSNPVSPDVVTAITILEALKEGKMPADAAHKIAIDFTNLPALFRGLGHVRLAEFTEDVLNDLKGREDEKKEGKAVVQTIGTGGASEN